ncbi:UNVERIFIED_CONTAM: hypothetical protein Slati_3821500, partial [Sesamum latifolium]
NAPKPKRVHQQQKGKAPVAPRRKEKADKNVENVIFEIGESSNTKARNQQGVSNVDAIGIESNNQFQVLNQMENEDDGAESPGPQPLQIITDAENYESTAPITRSQPAFNHTDANVTVQRTFDVTAFNLDDCGDGNASAFNLDDCGDVNATAVNLADFNNVNVVDHYASGIVNREYEQACLLNLAPMVFTPPAENNAEDSELYGSPADDLKQPHCEHSEEDNTSATQSSWEDATVRGKHTRSHSFESSQSYQILTRSKVKNGVPPTSNNDQNSSLEHPWYRGITQQRHVHWLCQSHKPKVLVIIEPKVYLDEVYFCRRFGFNKVFLHLRFSTDLLPHGLLCTWVYAKHTRAQRRELWNDIRNINPGDEPWLLGGDFNIILEANERKGGAAPKIRTMEDFSDMLLDCGLQDAGFEGAQFTWSRNRLWQRLDRFLYSPTWLDSFPLTRIQHLTRNVSDHCPLLLTASDDTKRGPAPFRFQNMWTKHHDFRNCVTTSWQYPMHGHGMFKFQQKLYRLKAALKTWNFEVFENIFKNIEKAEQMAKNCEQLYDNDPTDANLIAMNKATAELTFALWWRNVSGNKKQPADGLPRGKKNTKYFHSLVKKKRKQSYIHAIQHNGAVLTKSEEIKESVVDYFKQVFTEEEEVSYDPLLWVPNLLSEEDTQHLCTLPTLEDVKSVIFDMCPDSTAGPMGTPPPKNFTTATIVLIPKTENPETWKDFRPISLCNVTGKILSKLMNHQVATVLPKVISPSQSGFVQGRLIADNILLAQELVHCLGANGSKNNTIFKLDMAKAYDRLNWNFLYRMLSRIVSRLNGLLKSEC